MRYHFDNHNDIFTHSSSVQEHRQTPDLLKGARSPKYSLWQMFNGILEIKRKKKAYDSYHTLEADTRELINTPALYLLVKKYLIFL